MSEPIQLSDEDDRETVRCALDRSLFVEAGAGTGKTTALVDRICELVLTDDTDRRIHLRELAAITFTEAAAAELRHRIRSKFEAELRSADANNDESRAELCRTALADADVAAISTLHAFAQRLLSEYPVEVKIPPRVEVVDEVQSILAFDERWSDFVDELYADTNLEEFIVRASILNVGLGSTGSPLRTLAHIFDDNWDRLIGIDTDTPLAAPIEWAGLRSRMQTVVDRCAECTEPADKLFQTIQSADLPRFAAMTRDTERLRFVNDLVGSKGWSGGNQKNWSDKKSMVEACGELIETARTVLDYVAHQTLTLLAARIASFTVTSADRRRAEGVLEFHDLLVLARRLLRTSPEARAGLSKRYRVLMLDEFQDTDPIQIELALLLAGSVDGRFTSDWRDIDVEGGRIFMVGDPKQSIYRFRRADIDQFNAMGEKFSDGLVRLTQNFRTTRPIIDVVNALFGPLMTAGPGQADYIALDAVREPSPEADHRPVVVGGPRAGRAGEVRESEAAHIAATIDLIRARPAEWPVCVDGTWRDPELSDITILLPTRTSLTQLTTALDQRRIAYRADTGTLVYETQEVRDLVSVLRAVDDPTDGVALVAALRSPLYGCADDDLLAWAEAGADWSLRGRIPDKLVDSRVASAIEHLRSLAERRWWDEPGELLARIIEDRNVFALATARDRPRDAWRRIRYVLDQAREFAESGGGDLRAYLSWTALQGVDGAKAHEPMLPEPDDDAVSIMTIHGSKGLEFPITIVSGLTTEDPKGGRGVQVHWNEEGTLPEIKLKSNLRTTAFDMANDLEAEMDRAEKDRLLYVALTRARDHLVVSGYHTVGKDGKPRASHGARIHAFATDSGAPYVQIIDGPLDDLLSLPLSMSEAAHDPIDVATAVTDETPEEWSSRRLALIGVAANPSVISATRLAAEARSASADVESLADEEPDPALDIASPDTKLPPQTFRRGRAGTAIGSAVHGVLQFVDLADPNSDEIDRLVASQAWAESVPEHSDTIANAVSSALATPIVEACRDLPHWKELFVAAPVGSLTVEGYVDLLVDTPDGLVVVDYKTDSVSSEAEVAKKLAGYEMQGAAYAVAIEAATGRTVVDVQFIFARAGGAVVRSVRDLPALRARVSARAATA
ncbi:MAG: UvrD-helicase domain-containing protein [Acidimicrobiales bacterium]